MFLGHRIGGGMYCFATMERYGNEGHVDSCSNADTGSNFDFAFDPRLDAGKRRC